MNLLELRDDLEFCLNATSGQTHQDFTTSRLNKSLNRAYVREGGRNWFLAQEEVVWTANQNTFVLPTHIRHRQMYEVWDVTSGDLGTRVHFGDNGLDGNIFWLDHKTLQWGTSGPGTDRTLRVQYYAEPEELIADSDEPTLIPVPFHELLVWSAAVWLRSIADEKPPEAWVMQREELRFGYYKHIARGRPVTTKPWIDPHEGESEFGVYY